jgi:outer membrane beta-barrel protein
MQRRMVFRFCAVVLGLCIGGSAAARTRSLAEQPIVRHKVELRDKRLEIAPTFEASIAAEFKHTISGGLKIEYHITDTLSIGALGFFGTGINTGLLDQIVTSLPTMQPEEDLREPLQSQALQHANTIPIHGGVGITFTPWFGKLGLFGRAFFSYDVYISGGFGFAITENTFPGEDREAVCDRDCDNPDPARRIFDDPRNDGPHNAGFNPGIQYGGGLHLYFSNFAALDLSIRNYMFADNPSGFDVNFDQRVTNEDRRFLSHLFVGVGLSFYLPPRPKISR